MLKINKISELIIGHDYYYQKNNITGILIFINFSNNLGSFKIKQLNRLIDFDILCLSEESILNHIYKKV